MNLLDTKMNETNHEDPEQYAMQSAVAICKILNINFEDQTKILKNENGSNNIQSSLLLIRLYCSLLNLVENNLKQMHKWMETYNRHTKGIPIRQILSSKGLINVVKYLEYTEDK